MYALTRRISAMQRIKYILGAAMLCGAFMAVAQPAGEVEFSRGVGFAQSVGALPRTLGAGLPLQEGDRLTTGEGATAIIKLKDGTRMTLRPNTEMIVQRYQFKAGDADNGMVMQLLRGGFRAITGLISKGSPNAAKVHTATATIGIRGTDFDTRICGPECKAESAQVTEKPKPNAVQASAKLLVTQGDISATDEQGRTRKLVDGASVYPGETVNTGAVSKGVLVFRDDSRLTLGASTAFKVDSFVFDEKKPAEGNFLVTLLRGSLRAVTGLIGKVNPRNVGYSTPTATIGIRGTGLDLDCAALESCSFFTWLGTIEVTQAGQSATQTLPTGQGLYVSRTATRPLTESTLKDLPRPDSVPVDLQQLFGTGGVSAADEGLFVYVRDGHIELTTASQTLHMGRGETGFAAANGRTGRPAEMPLFIQSDKTPMPNSANPMLLGVLGEVSNASSNQCR